MEPNPPSEGSIAAPPVSGMSLGGRLMNIFAAPDEVFSAIKIAPASVANWLAPMLIYAVAGVVATFIMFSQPAILQQIHEQQAAALDKQVKDGKMTQAQEDQALQMMEKFSGPTMMKVFGSVGSIVGSAVHVIWWAFILWLMAALFLKTKVPFQKMVEVAGVATMILVLGAVVTVLLTVITAKLGITLSPALLVSNYDMKNKAHLALAALNVFSIWQLVVLAIGLARLTGTAFARSLLVLAIYWAVYCAFCILVGMGQLAL
jgi:Yip1 domain